ncbi:hypothetical protein [Bacillus smithii]|uniref:hypothetical protein n=1 Tax=Bacillus smithii TaxID=1479 RepID=UPI003D198C19
MQQINQNPNQITIDSNEFIQGLIKRVGEQDAQIVSMQLIMNKQGKKIEEYEKKEKEYKKKIDELEKKLKEK